MTFGILFIGLMIHEFIHTQQTNEPYAVCYDFGLTEDADAYVYSRNFNELGIVKYINNSFVPKMFVLAVHGELNDDPIEQEAYFIDSFLILILIGLAFYTEKRRINKEIDYGLKNDS